MSILKRLKWRKGWFKRAKSRFVYTRVFSWRVSGSLSFDYFEIACEKGRWRCRDVRSDRLQAYRYLRGLPRDDAFWEARRLTKNNELSNCFFGFVKQINFAKRDQSTEQAAERGE